MDRVSKDEKTRMQATCSPARDVGGFAHYPPLMPSQVIRSLAYEADRNELTVVFTNDQVYVYSLIPPAVFAALEAAGSKGAYFNRNIRDRYPFRKVKKAGPPQSSLLAALRKSQ